MSQVSPASSDAAPIMIEPAVIATALVMTGLFRGKRLATTPLSAIKAVAVMIAMTCGMDMLDDDTPPTVTAVPMTASREPMIPLAVRDSSM